MIVVIGNAGSIIGHGLGKVIDACDVIVRCNAYRFDGYESDVGTRVTHWASGMLQPLWKWLMQQPNQMPSGLDGRSVAWMLCNQNKASNGPMLWKKLAKHLTGRGITNVVSYGFNDMAEDVVADFREAGLIDPPRRGPSTGLKAVAVAIGEWPNEIIQIAGFGPSLRHYWQEHDAPCALGTAHCAETELELLDKWETRGDVLRIDA